MGDKTIALALGQRYRRPWPVMLDILLATLLNHGLAALLGAWAPRPSISGCSAGSSASASSRSGCGRSSRIVPQGPAGGTLGVRSSPQRWSSSSPKWGTRRSWRPSPSARVNAAPLAVTVGTTAGMLVADALAVFAGSHFATAIPLPLFRRLAAALFFVFGIASIAGALRGS